MNRLDCAGRASAIALLAAVIALCSVTGAEARKAPKHTLHNAAVHRVVPTARPEPSGLMQDQEPAQAAVQLSEPTLSIISEDKIATADTPTIVHPGRRIFCVEFARLASGIALFGDARTWWDQARNAYAQLTNPAPGAVMVFDRRKTMRSG